jgi:hypothetical protein
MYLYFAINDATIINFSPVTWPRGLRHELSSQDQTLRSWVRILLEALISVHLFCVCTVLCVQALRWADSTFKESYRLLIKSAKALQWARVPPMMIISIFIMSWCFVLRL